MNFQQIITEKTGNAGIITINRESKMNALNIALLQEIKQAVKQFEGDDTVRGIIITGSGEKAFAAGADISEFASFTAGEATKMAADGHEVMMTIERCTKPVIAAVNGFALGGGCELAMSCHIRIASENARFGQPEVNLGVPPGYGGTQRLAQLIGKGRALELLITANMIKADVALNYGLVNAVVPLSELKNTCVSFIDNLAAKSPKAIAQVIACVNTLYETPQKGMAFEIEAFGNSFETSDFKEGTSAFLEKRTPQF